MNIPDPEVLAEFRTPGPCENCGKLCKQREPAHIFPVSGGRLDIRINLVALGSSRPFPLCDCHASNHQRTNGKVLTQQRMLEITSAREQTTPEAITAEVYRIRALPQPRVGGPEEPLGKKKPRSAVQERANAVRRAAWRKAYQKQKAWKKAAKAKR